MYVIGKDDGILDEIVTFADGLTLRMHVFAKFFRDRIHSAHDNEDARCCISNAHLWSFPEQSTQESQPIKGKRNQVDHNAHRTTKHTVLCAVTLPHIFFTEPKPNRRQSVG